MEEATARTVVKTVAVLHFVAAGLLLLYFVPMLSMFLTEDWSQGGLFGRGLYNVAVLQLVVLMISIVLSLLVGYGLWVYRNWARVLLVVMTAITFVATLLSGMGEVPAFNTLLVNAAILLYCCAILYLFQNPNGPCRRLFTGQPPVAVKNN